MFDTLIKDISKLHREIHADEALPANEIERQAAYIFSGTQRILMELIYDNVGPRTLELGLLYNWLSLATFNRGYDDQHLNKYTAQLDMVMQKLVNELKTLETELEDEGPTPQMEEIGNKIQQLRDLAGPINEANLPQQEIERQTDKTVRALFGFTAECLQKELHPGLLESSMLYHWLRASTINANVPETLFQKLERHWPTVVKRVGTMTDKMLSEQ